eukprot:COSAG06_NODE_3317_length_5512_cov_2.790689_1_plen_173_part_00
MPSSISTRQGRTVPSVLSCSVLSTRSPQHSSPPGAKEHLFPLRFSEVKASFVKTSLGQAPKKLKKREAVFAGVRRLSRSSSSSQRKSRGNPTTARSTMRRLHSRRMARLPQSALTAAFLLAAVVGGSGRCGTRRSRSTISRCSMNSTRPTLNAPTRPKAPLRTFSATTSQSL